VPPGGDRWCGSTCPWRAYRPAPNSGVFIRSGRGRLSAAFGVWGVRALKSPSNGLHPLRVVGAARGRVGERCRAHSARRPRRLRSTNGLGVQPN
jgi:hypothetical protein